MVDIAAAAVLGLMLFSGYLGAVVGGVAGLLVGLGYQRYLDRRPHDDYVDDPPVPEPDDEPDDRTEEIPVQEELALLSGHDGDGPGLYGRRGRHRLRNRDNTE
jgi:hypothetical protein